MICGCGFKLNPSLQWMARLVVLVEMEWSTGINNSFPHRQNQQQRRNVGGELINSSFSFIAQTVLCAPAELLCLSVPRTNINLTDGFAALGVRWMVPSAVILVFHYVKGANRDRSLSSLRPRKQNGVLHTNPKGAGQGKKRLGCNKPHNCCIHFYLQWSVTLWWTIGCDIGWTLFPIRSKPQLDNIWISEPDRNIIFILPLVLAHRHSRGIAAD